MDNIKEILSLNWVKPTILEDREEIINEVKTGKRVLRVQMKYQHEGIINTNRRRYRPGLLQRELARLTPLCAEGKVLGAGYHPEKEAEVPDTAMIWDKVWREADGSYQGEARIIPTRVGEDAQTIIRNGGYIGVSSRGRGHMTEVTEEVDGKKETFFDIDDDYRMDSPGDLVITPSVPDAGIIKVLESRRNRADGSIAEKREGDKIVEIKTMEELRTAHPDLIKQLEDSVAETLKADIQTKIDEALETKKVEWRTEMDAELGPKITALEENETKVTENVKKAINALKGIVEEEAPEDKDDKEADSALVEKVKTLEATNEELKTSFAELKKGKETEVKEAENQKAMKTALDEELAKDVYKAYGALIREDLYVDEKVLAKDVEDVAVKVAASFKRIERIVTEQKKTEIVGPDTGKLEPERTDGKLTENEMKSLWEKAIRAGADRKKLTYKIFKEEVLPRLSE